MKEVNFETIKEKISKIFPQQPVLFNGTYSNVYLRVGENPHHYTTTYGNDGLTIIDDNQFRNYHVIKSTFITYEDILKGGDLNITWKIQYLYDGFNNPDTSDIKEVINI